MRNRNCCGIIKQLNFVSGFRCKNVNKLIAWKWAWTRLQHNQGRWTSWELGRQQSQTGDCNRGHSCWWLSVLLLHSSRISGALAWSPTTQFWTDKETTSWGWVDTREGGKRRLGCNYYWFRWLRAYDRSGLPQTEMWSSTKDFQFSSSLKGNLLARCGMKVLILEKHYVAGKFSVF